MMIRKELELYVHIPFCVRKCAYCDFLSAPAGADERSAYVDALIREIGCMKKNYSEYRVSTVFMGGGTPSVLDGDDTARIFDALHRNFDIGGHVEVTMEVNPGTVTEDKLGIWRTSGVNRLSIGLQSADDRELKMLGRIHTYQDFLETYALARKAGFGNINVDLISAVPGQTEKDWEKTLRTVAELGPEHISAYSLIIEEGTPFFEHYGESGKRAEGDGPAWPPLPDEDEDRAIYEATAVLLQKYGYHRYEISNYAKDGYECRHNLGYWERKEYLGLGLGASSLIRECRFHNTADMEKYLSAFSGRGQDISEACCEKIREEKESLTVEEQMAEFMFLGLRKMRGVSANEFRRAFGAEMEQVYGGQIRKLKEEGLLEEQNGWLYLTGRGIDISNYVFCEFV